jgi:hypothetical protein
MRAIYYTSLLDQKYTFVLVSHGLESNLSAVKSNVVTVSFPVETNFFNIKIFIFEWVHTFQYIFRIVIVILLILKYYNN